MKCLSIRQPWAWLVVHGPKDVENRDRRFKHRGPLLIHAAAWMTEADYEACRIFVDGIATIDLPPMEAMPRGGIVGQVDVVDCVDDHPSPWFTGPHGLVLANPVHFAPIKWRGMPSLFDVPAKDLIPALARCSVGSESRSCSVGSASRSHSQLPSSEGQGVGCPSRACLSHAQLAAMKCCANCAHNDNVVGLCAACCRTPGITTDRPTDLWSLRKVEVTQ